MCILSRSAPLLFLYYLPPLFTKITAQHQHLFLLKPTPLSAGRLTKTEADHTVFFISFTHSLSLSLTYIHTYICRHIHQACTYVFSSSQVRARASLYRGFVHIFVKVVALRFVISVLHFIKYFALQRSETRETHHQSFPCLLIWHLRTLPDKISYRRIFSFSLSLSFYFLSYVTLIVIK